VEVVDQRKVPGVVRIDFLAMLAFTHGTQQPFHTLSVAIFIHSSKLANKGITRFPGVTAVPVTSGISWSSCDGV
jgi:hypothetical protein